MRRSRPGRRHRRRFTLPVAVHGLVGRLCHNQHLENRLLWCDHLLTALLRIPWTSASHRLRSSALVARMAESSVQAETAIAHNLAAAGMMAYPKVLANDAVSPEARPSVSLSSLAAAAEMWLRHRSHDQNGKMATGALSVLKGGTGSWLHGSSEDWDMAGLSQRSRFVTLLPSDTEDRCSYPLEMRRQICRLVTVLITFCMSTTMGSEQLPVVRAHLRP